MSNRRVPGFTQTRGPVRVRLARKIEGFTLVYVTQVCSESSTGYIISTVSSVRRRKEIGGYALTTPTSQSPSLKPIRC